MKSSWMWAALAIPAIAGCDAASAPGGGGREEHYRSLATRFGEHLKSGSYAAAYEMTSKRYRSSHTLEAFTAFIQRAEKKYGKATHVGPSINTVEADGSVGDDLNFPKDLPAKDRRARLVVRMANGPDAIIDCLYQVWINIIDEDGADRIVTIEIPGINM